MSKTLREEFTSQFDSPYTNEIVAFIESKVRGAEKRGIATCINLIPEEKVIEPLGGDKRYYAGYNAAVRHSRFNFDKYFNSLN